MTTVYLVDNDESVRTALARVLRSAKMQVHSFANVEELLSTDKHHEQSCVIADIRMPGIDALELPKMLTDSGCNYPVIFLSAQDTKQTRAAAIRAGGVGFFRKPIDWEGGYRVLVLVSWPGKIKPGQIYNDFMSMQDWAPTLMAAAGEPDIKEKLKKGPKADGKKFKVHLDGYNYLPYSTGQVKEGPRKEFFYFSDDGSLVAVRHKQWKLVFAKPRAKTFRVWSEPFVQLRIPKPFNLRNDPFERADTDSNNYDRWWIERSDFSVTAIQEIVGEFVSTFKDFPPRQKPAKFNVDGIMSQMYKIGAH